MKNYYKLIPGNAKQYQLIPGKSDQYQLIPGQSKHYDLIPAQAPQFTLIQKPRFLSAGLEQHDQQQLRRKISEMRQVTEVSKSAMDQLSTLYVYIENRLLRTLAAADAMQQQQQLTEESAQVIEGIHAFLTDCFLRRVLTLFDAKSNTILAKVAQQRSIPKGDNHDQLHRA